MEDISRRFFVKGGAAFAASAAITGAIGVGTANASEAEKVSEAESYTEAEEESEDASAATELSLARSYSTYLYDVVIVGSGIAGLTAARAALDAGKTVAIVDKGQYGHSGNSGLNWGHAIVSYEYNDDPDLPASDSVSKVYSGDGVVDQEYTYSLISTYCDMDPLRDAVQLGCVTEHDTEGHPVSLNTYGTGMTETGSQDAGVFPRMMAQYVKRLGANIYDYTFVLDILTSEDGVAAGVAAVDLNTGEAKVFRAKSVIMATGSYICLCGWNGVTPYTHGSLDCTGDGSAMFLRAGLSMRDMEELCYDNGQYAPAGTRNCMTGMGVEITDHYRGFNNNYEMFSQPMIDDQATYMNQGTYMRLEMREIWEGRGTEHGGIWGLTDDLDEEERYYRNAKWNMERIFGWELPQYVELIPQCWETAGRPFTLDATTSQTEIAGLFYAGAATFVWNGSCVVACLAGGKMAGEGAVALVEELEAAPEVRTEQIESIFGEAYGLLVAEADDGIRAQDVKRNVQTSFWDGMYFLRNEEGIQGTIDELTRIQEEDLPRMVTVDDSPQYNTEWRNALEARNMITVGIGAAQAALIRRECRGAHCRTDYPKVDNENYMANTKVSYVDGTWSAEMVEAGGILMDHDTLVASIPAIGLEE